MKPYFHQRVEEGFHTKFGKFCVGDDVKVVSGNYPKFPHKFGKIVRMVHSNHGKGRVYAVIVTEDGREITEPLGRCRRQ